MFEFCRLRGYMLPRLDELLVICCKKKKKKKNQNKLKQGIWSLIQIPTMEQLEIREIA